MWYIHWYNGFPTFSPLLHVIADTIHLLNYHIKMDNIQHGLVHVTIVLSVKNTIDVFLTYSTIVTSHGVINYNILDHLAIYLTLKKSKQLYKSTTFIGRTYLNYDKTLFQHRLFYTNWGRFFALHDVKDAWDFFFNIILRESDLIRTRNC